jgi:osmotically-inducible protein OsmY
VKADSFEALDADRDIIEVTVGGGVVTLSRTVDQASTAAYAVRLMREVPGVIDVVGRLHWRVDDSGPVCA